MCGKTENEVEFKPGWLSLEIEAAREEIATWPDWLRFEVENQVPKRGSWG